ncbi:hypothetical protein [Sphingopyxis sp. GW247-27LB]|uniref:hypothetical protein n=1 Tax=Sphingopyxis sp. GW247-27LB TaxID=2012632 RepID=UPI000BA5735E|nr:hypothetical protein [Sphingopyxis sp. GW247-27LB]PAL20225.1 hypothetical protein CD928_17615 [Sphingopyxis sp. GW247-27LB]
MMPRLKAEEQLARIDATALAMGHYDKGTVRQKMRSLRDAAMGDRRRVKVKASPAQLGMVGIGVRMLPAPDKKAVSDG